MSSGFPTGLPDFFSSSSSSSTNSSSGTGFNTRPINPTFNNNIVQHHHHQQPMMFNRSENGKRTLAEFQNPLLLRHLQQQQQHQHQLGIGTFPMRSVKPRIFQNPSPISTLSSIDLLSSPEINNNNNNAYMAPCGVLQPRLQNPIGFGHGSVVPTPNQNMIQTGGVVVVPGKPMVDMETEKQKLMMMSRLHELEKQLLDDDDVVEEQAADASGDSVSVITGNEWTETIQNLIATDQKIQQPLNTSSPSSSSSSCSSTVTSPLPISSKQSIIEATAAIADGKSDIAAEIVTRVAQLSNPRGTPEQKLAFYMTSALKSKLNSSVEVQQKSSSEIRSKEHYESVRLLHQQSSCFRLGFLASNLAIIEATADAKSLHVVEFDIGDGAQYQKLLHLLSLRKSGKPTSVRITAVDLVENGSVVDDEKSRITIEKLSQLGDRVGVPLQLKTLRLKIDDVSRVSLSCNEDEVLAVNLAYSLSKLPDESVSTENQRDSLLRRVKGLKARIVTLTEQDMNCNTAPFQTRVAECLAFYGALLESMDSVTDREESDRIRVEEGLGRMMKNAVGCEGVERVERCEVLGKWRARMGMAGFELKRVSANVVDSLSSRINNNSGGGAGTLFVKESNGGVCFGWMGRILTVTSAWR